MYAAKAAFLLSPQIKSERVTVHDDCQDLILTAPPTAGCPLHPALCPHALSQNNTIENQDLEKDLQAEENKLRDAQDSIQEKGQMGFLRMAAQVDNFRKTSGVGTGDYEADAKAAVLTAMLPAFEPFEAAAEVSGCKYAAHMIRACTTWSMMIRRFVGGPRTGCPAVVGVWRVCCARCAVTVSVWERTPLRWPSLSAFDPLRGRWQRTAVRVSTVRCGAVVGACAVSVRAPPVTIR